MNVIQPTQKVGIVIALLASIGWTCTSTLRKSWTFDFDPPDGFSVDVGRWNVVQDGENQAIAQQAENRDSVFNVVLIDQTSAKNVDLTVRMKAVAGENERGGGIVWRAIDQDNDYVIRYNPLAGDAVSSSGTMFGTAEI